MQTQCSGGMLVLLTFEFWDMAREGSLCVLRAALGAKRATVTMSLCA